MTGMIEKVYSEALFELGTEDNNLDMLYEEVSGLAKVFETSPDLIKLLSAPTVSVTDKLSMIERLFSGRISDGTYNFLCVLAEKNRVKYLVKIAGEFKAKYNDHNGIAEMTVTTSQPLNPKLKEKLTAKLEQTTGKKVSLIEKVDEAILGGIILNYGNTQMNSSVKSKLDAIYAQMKSIIA